MCDPVMELLFDTHAHYDDGQFDEDRTALLSSMAENGVGLIVNPGCDVATSRFACGLAEQYPFVYAAAGIHPSCVKEAGETDLEEIERLLSLEKTVALGEIGLDYYWDTSFREKQLAFFRRQMALAEKHQKPVILHDREAHQDCFDVVKSYPAVKGVYHCYSGSAEMAKELLKLGYYLSFTGVITYKNARRAEEVIRIVPDDRIMIETDSPYLAPVPNRGKRNDSRNVRFVAEKIAEIKEMPVEEVIRQTRENGKRFYGI